jgi:hypothetical protein
LIASFVAEAGAHNYQLLIILELNGAFAHASNRFQNEGGTFCANYRTSKLGQGGCTQGASRCAVHLLANPEESRLASNEPVGDGHRIGAVKKRSQLKRQIMGEEHYTKRDKTTGEFMAQKKDGKKFKGVRKEH